MRRRWRPAAAATLAAAVIAVGALDVGSAGACLTWLRPALARMEASEMLSLVRLPAGTVRHPGEPASARHHLGGTDLDANAHRADAYRYYVADARPRTLTRWLVQHPPRGSFGDYQQRDAHGWMFVAHYDALGQWFDPRDLEVRAVSIGAGRSAVRVDALVTWLVARGPSDEVAPGAARLSITRCAARPGARCTVGYVSTRPRVIDAVAALVDQQRPVSTSPKICPAIYVIPWTITFSYERPARVTRAVVELGGCGTIQLYQGSRAASPTLQIGDHFLARLDRLVRPYRVGY
jgi:hypothetical protein